MHDTLTDYYKHLRGTNGMRDHLIWCGMESIEAGYAENGVEARAGKPSKRDSIFNQPEVLAGSD